jgi:hypothetical protein
MGSLRISARVWSWVVTWSLSVLASSLGFLLLSRQYIFGRMITELREAGFLAGSVTEERKDLRRLTSGWSRPATAGRSPAIR